MAVEPTREQIALMESLASGSASDVADFLSRNDKKMRRFTGLSKSHFNRLVDYLNSGDTLKIEKARDRLDESLDHVEKIPTRGLKLDGSIRKAVVKAQRNDEFFQMVGSVRGFLKSPLKNAIKLPAEIWAVTMASLGVERRMRNVAITGVSVPILAATAFNALVATTDAEAAIPPVQDSAHSQTLDGDAINTRMGGPLELTITRGHSAKDAFAAVLMPQIDRNATYKLMPALEKHIKRDPQARQYVLWMQEAAKLNGIDGNLFANQLYKESAWFDADVIAGRKTSPAGALGIAQFMPPIAKAYGLEGEDVFDPQKAIFAAARKMGALTKQYGDQNLAMVAYNGGPDAVSFVKKELGLNDVSITQWVSFMRERRDRLGDDVRSAWHVETLGYVESISSSFWGAPKSERVVNLPDLKDIPKPVFAPGRS